MKYKHIEWTIEDLLDFIDNEQIELSPYYQRNPIWSNRDKRLLVDTILKKQPIPNFFILDLGNGSYEMVDGQQRARSIHGYYKDEFKNIDGFYFSQVSKKSNFLNYLLNITLISNISTNEAIEDFYSLVNSSGRRLNRPEIRKAKYYDTNFLKLSSEMAGYSDFVALELFSKNTIARMSNVELVAELLALLKHGIDEKKSNVDRLFEDDISTSETSKLETKFKKVVNILFLLNKKTPIKNTRFRQRADIYSLFHFINNHSKLPNKTFEKYYEILLDIAGDKSINIKPMQPDCLPLQEYARHCVSQSNSKLAREGRNSFLEDVLRNSSSTPNGTQIQIINFRKYKKTLIKLSNAWTIVI